MIAIERLHDLFKLDAETGILTWRVSTNNRVKVGAAVIGMNRAGYIRVCIDRKYYLVHRVVFAMIHSRWPVDQIDHINGVRADNRPENIREATSYQNNQNVGIRKSNTSGMKGVSWNNERQKWQAHICLRGKNKYLGLFSTIEEASAAYQSAAKDYHGEFFRRTA